MKTKEQQEKLPRRGGGGEGRGTHKDSAMYNFRGMMVKEQVLRVAVWP